MSWGQVILFLVVLAGALAEGEVVIVGFAVLSVAARFPLSPWAVAAAGVAGTVIGDQAMYWIGRTVQDPYRFTWRGRPLLSEDRVRVLERFFTEHGKKTVFALRYAFGLRTVGYFFAGALKMEWRRFTLADLAGSVTWVGSLVLLGYLVGKPIQRLVREGWALAVAVPVAVALIVLVIWFQRRFERASEQEES